MNKDVLNSILKEYDQKKLNAELDLEKRKSELYNSIPRLQEIETELNTYAINKAKSILINNSSLDDLQEKINTLKNERNKILSKHNLKNDYLTPNYSCKLCKDTGYITHINKETEMCKCLKQRILNLSYDNSNLSNASIENFDKFNDSLFSDKVDTSKYKFNISPKKNIKNIKEKCQEFIENFDNPNTNNLLFTGNTGLRKNFYV